MVDFCWFLVYHVYVFLSNNEECLWPAIHTQPETSHLLQAHEPGLILPFRRLRESKR